MKQSYFQIVVITVLLATYTAIAICDIGAYFESSDGFELSYNADSHNIEFYSEELRNVVVIGHVK